MQVNETHPPSTKKDFILSHPDLSAKEVVAAAAHEGVSITTEYVYFTRSVAGLKARNAASENTLATSECGMAQMRQLEALFTEVALHIGLVRAEKILGELRLLGREITRHA